MYTCLMTIFVTMKLYEVCSLHLGYHIVALRRSTLLRMPGSRDNVEATGKRKKKSVRGSRQQGILWKGLHRSRLPAHPSSGSIEPPALP